MKPMKPIVKHGLRCWKCSGALKAETVHLQSGLDIKHYGCHDYGRKWPAGVKPQRMIAA
jgi:hypothetical protein